MSVDKAATFRLGEVCEINPRLPREGRPADSEPVSFVPMAAVSEISATIEGGEVRPYSDVKKGFTYFRNDDVLFAKITPCMENGKLALATNLVGGHGFGSTEFHVLRAGSRVLPEWIRYFVMRPQYRNEAKRRMTGAVGQQRVPAEFLENSLIFVPSLDEQRRIVELLSRAESIVRMRREAEAKAKEIIPALLVDMFGDPASPTRHGGDAASREALTVVRLGEVLLSAEYGTSTKATEEALGVPMIRMGNVDTSGRSRLEDLKYVDLPASQLEKYRLQPGDILFNRTNSKDLVGKTGLWRGECEAVAASYFIRMRVDPVRAAPDYVWAFLNTKHMKRVLFGMARGAIGQSNINAKELRGIAIPVPPLQEQQTFAERVVELLTLERQQSAATGHAERTFLSLLVGVFGDIGK